MGLRSFLIVLFLVWSPTRAMALDRHWNILSGSWGIAGNWSPSGIPGVADVAYVDYFLGAPGFATVSTNVGTPSFIQIANGGTVSVTAQGILSSGAFINVGADNTQGTLRVTNTGGSPFPGRLNVGSDLRIGVNSGVGTINHIDGTVSVAGTVRVAATKDPTSSFPAVGVYNLNGGVLTAQTMRIASASGGTPDARLEGTLNLGGSGVINLQNLEVGLRNGGGPAVVTQTGGQINVTSSTFIGQQSTGTYILSGGHFSGGTQTTIYPNNTFHYSGGSFAAAGSLSLYEGSRMLLSSGNNKLIRCERLELRVNAVVDLNDNAMIVNGGVTVSGLIASGYNGGAWNGNGIRSTAAAALPDRTGLGYAQAGEIGAGSFLGQSVSPANHLVRYTLLGDADLNGRVDISDFSRLAARFNSSGDWPDGDFDYNFSVGLGDFALLARNFNQSLARPPGRVPEPGVALASAFAALLMRRRRWQRKMPTRTVAAGVGKFRTRRRPGPNRLSPGTAPSESGLRWNVSPVVSEVS